jgi:hypothetical protein
VQDSSEVAEAPGGERMVRAQVGLEARKGALAEGAGVVEVALVA